MTPTETLTKAEVRFVYRPLQYTDEFLSWYGKHMAGLYTKQHDLQRQLLEETRANYLAPILVSASICGLLGLVIGGILL